VIQTAQAGHYKVGQYDECNQQNKHNNVLHDLYSSKMNLKPTYKLTRPLTLMLLHRSLVSKAITRIGFRIVNSA
jgi:hypothetical protein